jgi:FkbM family methyltransferase
LRNQIRHVPGLAWAQRAFIHLLAPKGEFAHRIDAGPARGLHFLIRLPQDKAMWKGTYELEFCERLKAAVRPGDVCYDIGAFRGYTAGVFALAGASKVYAFEPMPENQATIRKVVAMNPALPLELVAKAVADLEGEKVLEIHRDQSMNRLKSLPGSSDGERIVVETTTVDATAKARGMWPNLLKIDVEGAEEAVLKGAKEVLKKSVRGVFMEIHHPQAEAACRALLEQAGYECVWKEYEWGNYANQVMFQKK